MKTVSKFIVVDFDRCLGKTEALYDLFIDCLEDAGIVTRSEVEQARAQQKQTEVSFSFTNYLDERGTDGALRKQAEIEFQRRAIEVQSQLLEPGASDFLAWLSREGITHMIMTYGDYRWQYAKLMACGLNKLPYMITDYVHKAQEISSWQSINGFILPRQVTGGAQVATYRVALIDDKAAAFKGLPAHVRGYLLQLAAVSSDVGQEVPVPSHVQRVTSFDDIRRDLDKFSK